MGHPAVLRLRGRRRGARRVRRGWGLRLNSMAVLVAAGARACSRVVNSSSEKSSRQAALSTGWVRIASRENSMGTAVWMVTSSFESKMLSRLFGERFAIRLLRLMVSGVETAASSAASTVPNCWISSTEPLSPMPGAPGMLSTASPRRAITSMTRSGGTPRTDSTPAGSRTRLSLVGLRMLTSDVTSCIMSLSELTTKTRWPSAERRAASVPMTSSASKPS